MFVNINWDIVFNWKIWQVIKWIFGVIIIVGMLVILIDLNYNPEREIYKPVIHAEQEMMSGLASLLNRQE